VDLDLYARVLWRHRFLVLGGVALACALAVFSIARVTWEDGRPRLQYRSGEVWESGSRVQVTTPGFPEGSGQVDVVRLSSVAEVYAGLATSDEVMEILRKTGPLGTRFQISPSSDVHKAASAAEQVQTL